MNISILFINEANMNPLIKAILVVLDVIYRMLMLLSFAAVFCSWVQADRSNPLVQMVYRTTDPLFRPFRKISGRLLPGMDLSPMLFLLALFFFYTLIRESLLSVALAG